MTVNTIVIHFENKLLKIVSEASVSQSADWCAINHIESHPVKVQALWDTGADCCVVSSTLAQNLGLIGFGSGQVDSFGGITETDLHYIDLTLPDGHQIYNVPAAVYVGMSSQDLIIGMNVITMGDFALTRESGGTRFSFNMDKP